MVSNGSATLKRIEPTAALKELREKQRRVERMTIIIVSCLMGLIWLFILLPTGFINHAGNMIERLENGGEVTRNVAKACKDPRNQKTAYCLERAAKSDADWRNMSRFQNGKTNQFTLHGKE